MIFQVVTFIMFICFLLQVQELRYDYTSCENLNTAGQTCATFLDNQPVNNTGQTCYCKVTLELSSDFTVGTCTVW